MKIAHLIHALALVPMMQATAYAGACDNPRQQLDANECAMAQHAEADKALNQVHAAYQKRLTGPQARQFRQAQRAWLKFRDASCIFESSGVEGGSAYPMVYRACLAVKTQERVKAIKVLASCQEGDLGCPAPH